MKITRQITADKISEYLQGRVAQAVLVDWAEHAMMDEEFEPADFELLSDIIGRLGLADVAEFGWRWRAVAGATFTEGGAERERTRLGIRATEIRGTQSRIAKNSCADSATAPPCLFPANRAPSFSHETELLPRYVSRDCVKVVLKP